MTATRSEQVQRALIDLTIEREQLAIDRDRYREAFAMLANEIGEHVTWLRDWETDPDMSPHRAAAELESVIDDIMREEGIDDDE